MDLKGSSNKFIQKKVKDLPSEGLLGVLSEVEDDCNPTRSGFKNFESKIC